MDQRLIWRDDPLALKPGGGKLGAEEPATFCQQQVATAFC